VLGNIGTAFGTPETFCPPEACAGSARAERIVASTETDMPHRNADLEKLGNVLIISHPIQTSGLALS
jgi:hypothetical protein